MTEFRKSESLKKRDEELFAEKKKKENFTKKFRGCPCHSERRGWTINTKKERKERETNKQTNIESVDRKLVRKGR